MAGSTPLDEVVAAYGERYGRALNESIASGVLRVLDASSATTGEPACIPITVALQSLNFVLSSFLPYVDWYAYVSSTVLAAGPLPEDANYSSPRTAVVLDAITLMHCSAIPPSTHVGTAAERVHVVLTSEMPEAHSVQLGAAVPVAYVSSAVDPGGTWRLSPIIVGAGLRPALDPAASPAPLELAPHPTVARMLSASSAANGHFASPHLLRQAFPPPWDTLPWDSCLPAPWDETAVPFALRTHGKEEGTFDGTSRSAYAYRLVDAGTTDNTGLLTAIAKMQLDCAAASTCHELSLIVHNSPGPVGGVVGSNWTNFEPYFSDYAWYWGFPNYPGTTIPVAQLQAFEEAHPSSEEWVPYALTAAHDSPDGHYARFWSGNLTTGEPNSAHTTQLQ